MRLIPITLKLEYLKNPLPMVELKISKQETITNLLSYLKLNQNAIQHWKKPYIEHIPINI
jgi:hypothetical protein